MDAPKPAAGAAKRHAVGQSTPHCHQGAATSMCWLCGAMRLHVALECADGMITIVGIW